MHVRSFAITLFALAAMLAVSPSQAGWRPEYANMDPATRAWAVQATSELLQQQHAHSPEGGNCCAWADGYQLGTAYAYRSEKQNGKILSVVMFTKWWWSEEDRRYHAVVWDVFSEQYREVIAMPDAFSPGNPTGQPIVWLNYENGRVKIRCWGGEAQG